MANQEHLEILKQGVDVWNKWKVEHQDILPDLTGADLSGAKLFRATFGRANLSKANLSDAKLSGADLTGADLTGADLTGADLTGADLTGADLTEAYAILSAADLREAILTRADLTRAILTRADLTGADLTGAGLTDANLSSAKLSKANLSDAKLFRAALYFATLSEADLTGADLIGAGLTDANLTDANLTDAKLFRANLNRANLTRATLSGADLTEAYLREANLTRATLSKANLIRATLVETNCTNAILTDCHIYGISAWNVELTGATQNSLIITSKEEPTITVDNLEVAQFIYLLLNNAKIRDVIDTITSKVVLILGRFTPDRKAVLDALRDELRKRNYSPILFDFDKPDNRDITETVSTLAHMARFIIADLTEPSSIPKELEAIIPTLAVPVQPLVEGSTQPYAMFKDYWKYQWVLKVYRYHRIEELLVSLKEYVIEPAERKAKELAKLKAEE